MEKLGTRASRRSIYPRRNPGLSLFMRYMPPPGRARRPGAVRARRTFPSALSIANRSKECRGVRDARATPGFAVGGFDFQGLASPIAMPRMARRRPREPVAVRCRPTEACQLAAACCVIREHHAGERLSLVAALGVDCRAGRVEVTCITPRIERDGLQFGPPHPIRAPAPKPDARHRPTRRRGCVVSVQDLWTGFVDEFRGRAAPGAFVARTTSRAGAGYCDSDPADQRPAIRAGVKDHDRAVRPTCGAWRGPAAYDQGRVTRAGWPIIRGERDGDCLVQRLADAAWMFDAFARIARVRGAGGDIKHCRLREQSACIGSDCVGRSIAKPSSSGRRRLRCERGRTEHVRRDLRWSNQGRSLGRVPQFRQAAADAQSCGVERTDRMQRCVSRGNEAAASRKPSPRSRVGPAGSVGANIDLHATAGNAGECDGGASAACEHQELVQEKAASSLRGLFTCAVGESRQDSEPHRCRKEKRLDEQRSAPQRVNHRDAAQGTNTAEPRSSASAPRPPAARS